VGNEKKLFCFHCFPKQESDVALQSPPDPGNSDILARNLLGKKRWCGWIFSALCCGPHYFGKRGNQTTEGEKHSCRAHLPFTFVGFPRNQTGPRLKSIVFGMQILSPNGKP